MVAGCSTSASPGTSHHAIPKATKTVATSEEDSGGDESLTAVLSDWDSALASSDEVGLFTATLHLPDAVKADCSAALNADQNQYLSEKAVSAKAEVDQVTATNGGARALDIYKAWNGYVTFAKQSC